jgi:hypothetical protein
LLKHSDILKLLKAENQPIEKLHFYRIPKAKKGSPSEFMFSNLSQRTTESFEIRG